jgi:hypothetical protein
MTDIPSVQTLKSVFSNTCMCVITRCSFVGLNYSLNYSNFGLTIRVQDMERELVCGDAFPSSLAKESVLSLVL